MKVLPLHCKRQAVALDLRVQMVREQCQSLSFFVAIVFPARAQKHREGRKKMDKDRSRLHLVVTNVADKRKATLTRVNTDG